MRCLVACCFLAGCLDSEPAYEPKCPAPPSVSFRRNQNFVYQPVIAVGGAMNLSLVCLVQDLPGEFPLDQPFKAHVDLDTVVGIGQGGVSMQLVGLQDGTATLHITASNGETDYATLDVGSQTIDHLAVEGGNRACLKGTTTAAGPCLIDDRADIILPPGCATYGDGFFACNGVAPGTYTVEVVSGGMTYMTTFVI